MKSQIIPNDKLSRMQRMYPCLGWIPVTKLVVLFTADCMGVVIHQENNNHTIGEFSKGWMMDHFKPFVNATVQIGE